MSSFTRFSKEPMIAYSTNISDSLGKDHWVVGQAFTYYLNDDPFGDLVNVWPYFVTDGATVPRLFWGIVPTWGRYGAATIVHDFLCDGQPIQKKIRDNEFETIYEDYYPTRKEADQIFNQAMKVLKVPTWQRWLMYGAVRTFAFFTKDAIKNKQGKLNVI